MGREALARLLPLLVAAGLAAGCERTLRPDWVTPAGMQVFVEEQAQSFDGAELDAIIAEALSAFSDRWALPAELAAVRLPVLSILASDSYLLAGQQVAGNVSADGRWIYIGARTRPLHDTALVHELIHYFDLSALGATDHSHASWAGPVEQRLEAINRKIASGALRRAPR